MKDGRGQAKAASKGPGVKMLRPDFSLKLFEPVASVSGAEFSLSILWVVAVTRQQRVSSMGHPSITSPLIFLNFAGSISLARLQGGR